MVQFQEAARLISPNDKALLCQDLLLKCLTSFKVAPVDMGGAVAFTRPLRGK
jgi:hypothetical protein